MLTLPEKLSLHPVFCGVHVVQFVQLPGVTKRRKRKTERKRKEMLKWTESESE